MPFHPRAVQDSGLNALMVQKIKSLLLRVKKDVQKASYDAGLSVSEPPRIGYCR